MTKNVLRFCVNCKFYKKDFFMSLLPGMDYGQCAMFPIEPCNPEYLVTGKKKKYEKEYMYCSISRNYDHMCGKEGKFYEKK